MATININRKLDDPFYRYKMPKMQVRMDGSKTILVNISTIGKCLRRSPTYIAKFFAYEFSTSVRINEKEDRYIIAGYHDSETLQNTFDKFIEHFVLCPRCQNPETYLILCAQKYDEILKVCKACGYRSPVNMKSHRLSTYILKDLQNTTTAEVMPIEKQDEISTIDVDVDDDQLINLIGTKKNENKLNDIDTIQEIITNAEQLDLSEEASFIIAKHLFTENILKEIDEYKLLFQQLSKNNQKYLLYALEVLINDNDKFRRQIFHAKTIEEIFYKFYDRDIIDEKTFLNWYEKPSKDLIDKSMAKKIRQMAKGFIQWLNQADSSDDEN